MPLGRITPVGTSATLGPGDDGASPQRSIVKFATQVFGGYDPAAFLTQLQGKGFQDGSFKAIYLLACKVGEASQDNSIVTNFARDLKLALTGAGIDVKLYAPRGTLDYDIVEETRLGQTVPVVTRIFIDTPERQYPLSEGMLLVQ